MKTKITIEQLAERMGEKVWSKGDIKRIYLDRGHNTKKMSTKTYIYQKEDGSFGVSCYVDCPSQPFAWIKYQQDEVIEGVMDDIEDALSDTVYVMVNKDGNPCDWKGQIVELNYSDNFLQGKSEKESDNCAAYDSYIAIPRDEFNRKVDECDKIVQAELNEIGDLSVNNTVEKPASQNEIKSVQEEFIASYQVGAKYNHFKFGEVTLLSEDVERITIATSQGEKLLLKRFAKLTAL